MYCSGALEMETQDLSPYSVAIRAFLLVLVKDTLQE